VSADKREDRAMRVIPAKRLKKPSSGPKMTLGRRIIAVGKC